MKTKLSLDHLSDIDQIRAYLLERIVDKAKRLKIEHSSSLSHLRQEYYLLHNPIIIKTEFYEY